RDQDVEDRCGEAESVGGLSMAAARPRLRIRIWLACALLVTAATASAMTWNEPWQKQVITQASTFGLYEVLQGDGRDAKLHKLRTIAGASTPDVIELDGYYGLQLGSFSAGHDELEIALHKGSHVYLLPKQVGERWQTATPTAGIAIAPPGSPVHTTYRISFHQ